MGHTLVFRNVLSIVIPNGLGLILVQRNALRQEEQTSRGHVEMDEVLVYDVVNASITYMPLARIGEIVWFPWHTDFAKIMEEADNDATFLNDLGGQGLS